MQRPLFEGYRAHLLVEDGEYLGVSFSDVGSEVVPGELYRAQAHLVYWPSVDYSPLKVGVRFNVKEGERTVGHGAVLSDWTSSAV